MTFCPSLLSISEIEATFGQNQSILWLELSNINHPLHPLSFHCWVAIVTLTPNLAESSLQLMAQRVVAPGHSCLECRRRKIKCDRSLPCSYCARIKLQCSYPSWRPNRGIPGESDLAAKVQALECTLQSLEQKITRIGDLSHVSAELSSRQDHTEREHQFPIVSIRQNQRTIR